MATIALYANRINNMPNLIKDVNKSVTDFKSELSNLKNKSLQVNKGICNLDDVISTISSSTQTQEQKVASLESFQKNSEQFITDTARIDNGVADIVNQRKDDFYDKYYYLKPDCEKNGWEKFCDGVKAVGEWCKEHWKLIVVVVLVIVAIVVIVCTAGTALGPLAVILVGAAKGLLIGAITGGIMGGLSAWAAGGSFSDILKGFEDGAFTGAITGALMGGLGGLGQVAGNSIKCVSALGKTISVVSKVSGALSLTMGGFDMLAFGAGLIFGQDNFLTAFNTKLHSNKFYNAFQIGVSAIAVFTAGATSTMKCFVAGTMIVTATALVTIENIKAGQKVVSTNPETGETAEKTVLETYIRETTELVHLTISGELIKTTFEHPFYVKDVGFVNAGELYVGDKLLDASGNVLVVENRKVEITDEPVKVYNFQVEDFHTYHVGDIGVLVHNAKYDVGKYNEMNNEPGLDKHHVPQKAVMKKLDPNYDPAKGPSIKVPKEGHTIKNVNGDIVSRSTKGIKTVQDLINRDISELQRVFPDIPESVLDQLRNYP